MWNRFRRKPPKVKTQGNYSQDKVDERWADLALLGDFRRTDTVLDVGSAEGLVSLEIAPLVHSIHGIELKPQWVERARQEARRCGILNASFEAASALDYAPGEYDVIIILSVIGKDDDNGREIGIDVIERLLKAARRQIFIRHNVQAENRITLRNIFEAFERHEFEGVCFTKPAHNGNLIVGNKRGSNARIKIAPPNIVIPATQSHPCLRETSLEARPEFASIDYTIVKRRGL